MTIRVNSLGKSAIINRQLNGAYDVVAYVADNLPFLLDLMKKLETFHVILETYDVANHIADNSIHLSQEQISAINQIQSILAQLSSISSDLSSYFGSIENIQNQLTEHTSNSEIHVTQSDKDRWNSIEVPELAEVAITGSYNDLRDKPDIEIPELQVDSVLSKTSENAVSNKAVATEFDKYAEKESLSGVAFTGLYKDLKGVPEGDSYLSDSSENWVKNKTLTEAINNLSAGTATALTNAEIDQIIQGIQNDN